MALNWKPFSGENGSNALNGLMSTAGSVVGKVGGNLISGGKSTTAGGVMSGMADIAAAIPGPIGAIASAGLGILGGLTNAAFGTKWNDENIAKVESNIYDLNSFQTNAGDYDALTQTWKSAPVGMSFNNDYIGKDGWFSNKAADKVNDFRNQIAQGTDWVNRSLVNNADNIANMNRLQREANYRALGGFLPSFDTNGSTALMWDFATDYMNNKYGDSNDNTNFSVNPALNNIYAKGGKIHIKPENRGKFTKYCGGKVTSECIARGKRSSDPAVRKRATFASNSRHWSHDYGGNLNKYIDSGYLNSYLLNINPYLYDDNYYNGIYNGSYPTEIRRLYDEGGSTKESNNSSTPIGRFVPEEYQNTANFIWGGAEMLPVVGNFLDAADVVNDVYNMAKTKSVGYNDLANFALDAVGLLPGANILTKVGKFAKAAKMEKIAEKAKKAAAQLEILEPKNLKKSTGKAKEWSNRSSETLESVVKDNPIISRDRLGASVEANRFTNGLINRYDELISPNAVRYNNLKLKGTAADAVNDMFNIAGTNNEKALGGSLKRSDNFNNGVTTIDNGDSHENNPFEGVQMGIDPEGNPNLVEEGEVVYNDYVFSDRLTVPKDIRKKYKLGKKNITFAEAAKKMQKESEERPNDPISKNGLESLYTMLADYQEIERDKQMKNTKGNKYDNGSFLRYAPVLGSAIGLTENLLKRPDYSSVQRITDAANLAGEYTPIGYTPLGEYMTYNPFDREFYINRAAANAAATRRAITNQSGGNRATAMAGILAADRAYQNSLGDLARQAEEYNLNQREKVATFNRETDRANQTASLQAQVQNQAAQARARQARLAGIQSAETLRSQIDEARNNAINANISSLFGNLGEIGQDEFNRASADWWLTNVAPRLSTKPPYWSNKQWNDYLRLHGENIPEEPTRRERKKQKNEIKNDYNYTTPIDYSGDFWS